MIKYNLCRICNSSLKNKFLSFKNYPISLWPTQKKNKDKKNDLNVFECEKCKLIQLQRFSFKKISSFYYGGQYIVNDNHLLLKRYKKIQSFISEIKMKNKKILEIGGGRNSLLDYFPKSEKWLVDFSVLKKKNNNIKIIKKNFEKTNLPKEYFDYIIFFHTLEHIEDPKKFLYTIRSLLKKNGIIILEVPNLNFYLKQNPYHAFFFQHLSIFSPETLDNLLYSSGFSVLKRIIKKKIILNFYKKSDVEKKLFKRKSYSLKLKNAFTKNLKKNCKILKSIKKKKLRIGFYGTGGTALTLIFHLKSLINKIDYFYDSDPKKYKKYIPLTNYRIRGFKDLFIDKPEILIFNSKDLMDVIKKKYLCSRYILIE